MSDQSTVFGDLAGAISKVACELPFGYSVILHTEEGAAWIELQYNSEVVWEDGDYPDHTFAEKYLLALDVAKERVKFAK
jgi:hypothetical protein